MIELQVGSDDYRPKSVLLLGAHCDDIEIGCGGTISKLVKKYPDIEVYWVVFSSNEQRKEEALKSAECILSDVKNSTLKIETFRNGFFPYIGGEIKDYFEGIKKEINPDLIFTHYKNDYHQDHRIISELTKNTFRDNLIFEYEIPKYDGDMGRPNLYVVIEKQSCEEKIDNILKNFKSQDDKPWFEKELFFSLLRLRGMECQSKTRYAEAFYSNKQVVNF